MALKKVRFNESDAETLHFMAREILVLKRLNHPNVMKLEGLALSRLSSSLYLIFEYMEYDLARLAANLGINFPQPEVSHEEGLHIHFITYYVLTRIRSFATTSVLCTEFLLVTMAFLFQTVN